VTNKVVVVSEYTAADIVRAVLALSLTISFPFVLFFSEANAFTQTYENAITAVVGFYFAVRGTEGGRASEVADRLARP
jgi:hypothetical protein